MHRILRHGNCFLAIGARLGIVASGAIGVASAGTPFSPNRLALVSADTLPARRQWPGWNQEITCGLCIERRLADPDFIAKSGVMYLKQIVVFLYERGEVTRFPMDHCRDKHLAAWLALGHLRRKATQVAALDFPEETLQAVVSSEA